jgi:ketose-bisphosphate aldolase
MTKPNLLSVFNNAKKGKFAVGAFNIFNHISALAVINAAEESHQPVIIQTSVGTVKNYGVKQIVNWLKPMCDNASVPVYLSLDHCTDEQLAYECIDAGWDLVMLDGSHLPLIENIQVTKRVVDYAHEREVLVEGEVGIIKGVEDHIVADNESLAKLSDIQLFIEQTGVDMIAPSIGTAHGFYSGTPVINYDLINQHLMQSSVPLVVHGGSGLDRETYQQLVIAQVSKINISTSIKEFYMDYFRRIHVVKNPLAIDKELLSGIKEVVRDHILMFMTTKPQQLAQYPVDLHCHTTLSDGNLSPGDLVKKAISSQLSILAITDHDVKPPTSVEIDGHHYELADLYARYAITVIPGIEISCETMVEDVHILGYGCDFNHPFFRQLEELTIISKLHAYHELAIKLQEQGMDINVERVAKKNNISLQAIQKKHLFQELADQGFAKSWREAKIMVQSDERFTVYRSKPDPIDVIEAIHHAGGIAILAHPYLIPPKMKIKSENFTREEYIQKLVKHGLDGLEIQYSYDKTNYTGGLSKNRIRQELTEQFGKSSLIMTGGSDYHADEVKGVIDGRLLGENGMTISEFYHYPQLVNLIKK